MSGGIIALIISIATIVGGAVGWLFRQYRYRRESKRQAAYDAGEVLSNRKTLLEEMISKTQDDNTKQTLLVLLDEVNAALLGLYTKRLRNTLEEAGLPPEEALVTDGRTRLQPQQITQLRGIVTEVNALPSFLSTQDLLVLGNTYYYMEQYEDAEKIYDRVLDLNPDDPNTLHNRGTTYARLGRYNEALDGFNHCLELVPDALGVLNNRGLTYRFLKRYDESLADFNRALEVKPDYPEALYNRGNTYAVLKRYDKGLADFNRALELRPGHLDTLTSRGVLYTCLQRYEEALADFNHALELSPDDPGTLYNLACLFSLWGKVDDALAYLEKAIDGDKKHREMAKTDTDFDNIRDDPRFKKLIESD